MLLFVILLVFSLTACETAETDGSDVISPSDSGDSDEEQNAVGGGYALGDIILADGSTVTPDSFTAIDNDNPPVAVIAVLKGDGTALGVGVHRSAECLRFEAEAETEKTAFDFASEYAATYQINGEYASGWRLPEVEELKTIYANKATINLSLQKIYNLDNNAAMNGLGTVWYWTGTPASTKEGFTWFVHFVNGYAGECERYLTNLNVMAVRTFNNG